jgi:hypothetical protein
MPEFAQKTVILPAAKGAYPAVLNSRFDQTRRRKAGKEQHRHIVRFAS